MIILEPSVSQIVQKCTLQAAYNKAEFAGRICYNSIDKMIPGKGGTNEGFIKGLLAKGHYSPLAHGAIYLTIPRSVRGYNVNSIIEILTKDTFFTSTVKTAENWYITTNLRVLHEHFSQDEVNSLQPFIDNPTQYHDIYYTFRVQTSIGVTRELNRHAAYLAICEQSTRWCNFSKKEDGEVYFVKPWYYDLNPEAAKVWEESCKQSENAYMKLLEQGNKPDVARGVLNLSTRSIVIYSAPKSKWKHVLELRSPELGAKNVHPDCAIIADKIKEFIYEQLS